MNISPLFPVGLTLPDLMCFSQITHDINIPDGGTGGQPSVLGRLPRKNIMAVTKKRRPKKRRSAERSYKAYQIPNLMRPEQTGSETAYLKSLVDSRAKVTIVLKSGERLRGRVRYYDRDCFSIGLSARGPRFFLRKDSVSYILEE
jgi:sRNA-binding regulator protein Hfq